jgi:membrane protease YdiL (CAAX protease family)
MTDRPEMLGDEKAAIVIIGTLLFFYLYYYFSGSNFLKKHILQHDSVKNRAVHFLSKKLSGFLLLGLIPGLLYFASYETPFSTFGFTIHHFISAFWIILVLSLIIVSVAYLNQKANPKNNSLQIPIREWSFWLFAVNSFGWVLYLIAYEFLFRGILLTECNTAFGYWAAIAINTAIYSAIHMVNGRAQAIGALLFGPIACYFVLEYGTLWIPIFMHIALSLSADFFSIRFNPDLSYSKQKQSLK